MAFLQNDDLEEQRRRGQAPASSQSGIITGSGPNANMGPAGAPKAANPGNWVGINQYLDANKPQAASIADKIGSDITGTASQVKGLADTAASNASNAIKSKAIASDPQELAKLTKNPASADINRVSQMMNAGAALTGTPGSYLQADNDALTKAQAGLQQKVAATQTEEGRKGLISQAYKTPQRSVTQGVNNFDNLLLQAAPDAKTRISSAVQAADVPGVQGYVSGRANDVGTLFNQIQAQNQATQSQAQKAVDQARGQFETGTIGAIDKRIADIRNANMAAQSNIQTAVAARNPALLSDSDLGLLGISREQAAELVKSGNASDRLSSLKMGDMSGLGRGQVATPEEYAQYAALQKLAGIGALDEGSAFDYDHPNQSGKYNTDYLDFVYNPPDPAVKGFNGIDLAPPGVSGMAPVLDPQKKVGVGRQPIDLLPPPVEVSDRPNTLFDSKKTVQAAPKAVPAPVVGKPIDLAPPGVSGMPVAINPQKAVPANMKPIDLLPPPAPINKKKAISDLLAEQKILNRGQF